MKSASQWSIFGPGLRGMSAKVLGIELIPLSIFLVEVQMSYFAFLLFYLACMKKSELFIANVVVVPP